jgi:hypothetical protein
MESIGGVKSDFTPPLLYTLQKGDGKFTIDQEGVVVKGDVLYTMISPSGDFSNYLGGVTLDKSRIKKGGGAVSALKGAPPGGEDTAIVEMGIEIKGRRGKGIEIVQIGDEASGDSRQPLQEIQDLNLTPSLDDKVRP